MVSSPPKAATMARYTNTQDSSIAEILRKAFPNRQEQLKDVIWIAELFDECSKLTTTLKSDVDIAIHELSSTTDDLKQYRLRVLVRTLFASIEGNIAIFKQILLGCNDIGSIHLENDDLAIIIENERTINDQVIKPKRTPLKDVVKFIFTTFAMEISRREFKIDTDSKEWEAFCDSIKLRDRLTHPKTNNDMTITNQEKDDLLLASKWFFEASTFLWKLPIKVFEQQMQSK